MKTSTLPILLITVCITCITAYPQKDIFPPFTDVLFPAQGDTGKVNAINAYCKELIDNNNLKAAVMYAKLALHIGEKQHS